MEGGKYYLPNQDKPVATSLANLRKDLCINGLPDSTSALTLYEKVDMARWVRYTHVSGLVDGQTINPDEDLGKPIEKLMDGWNILTKHFGCKYSGGVYKVPASPNGTKKTHSFTQTNEVYRHFARFGIQCLLDIDETQEVLNKKDRLASRFTLHLLYFLH